VLQCVAVRNKVLAELQEITKEMADQQLVRQLEKSAQNYSLRQVEKSAQKESAHQKFVRQAEKSAQQSALYRGKDTSSVLFSCVILHKRAL